jgi:hypothetical protein
MWSASQNTILYSLFLFLQYEMKQPLCDEMKWDERCKHCGLVLGYYVRITWTQALQYQDSQSDNHHGY